MYLYEYGKLLTRKLNRQPKDVFIELMSVCLVSDNGTHIINPTNSFVFNLLKNQIKKTTLYDNVKVQIITQQILDETLNDYIIPQIHNYNFDYEGASEQLPEKTDKKFGKICPFYYASYNNTTDFCRSTLTNNDISQEEIVTSPDDIYNSWIGYCLAILTDGYKVYIPDGDVLKILYDGILAYRLYLSGNEEFNSGVLLKGGQLPNFLGFYFSFVVDSVCNNTPITAESLQSFFFEIPKEQGTINGSLDWELLVYNIARYYTQVKPDTVKIHMDVTGMNVQKNSTYGFIPVYIKEVYKINQFYKSDYFFGNRPSVNKFLWSCISFESVLSHGHIGLYEMKPVLSYDNEKQKKQDLEYLKLYLEVLLEDNELKGLMEQFASMLHMSINKQLTNEDKNIIKQLFNSYNKLSFNENLNEILSKNMLVDLDLTKKIYTKVNSFRTNEEVKLFITTLKTEYLFTINK